MLQYQVIAVHSVAVVRMKETKTGISFIGFAATAFFVPALPIPNFPQPN